MTFIDGGGLQLNADAPHPPFAWYIDLPSDWALLETHPARWELSVSRLIDDKLAGKRLKAADKREIAGHLADLVAAAQRAGTIISLVQIGQMSDGAFASAGLNVAWYNSAPEKSSMATVRRAARGIGLLEEYDSPAGPFVFQSETQAIAVTPGSLQRTHVTQLQAFLPLPDTTWTAIVASAAAQPLMRPVLTDIVLGVASSIYRQDRPPSDLRPAGIPFDPRFDGDGPAKPSTDGIPGMERGFGTMLRHQIQPEADHTTLEKLLNPDRDGSRDDDAESQ